MYKIVFIVNYNSFYFHWVKLYYRIKKTNTGKILFSLQFGSKHSPPKIGFFKNNVNVLKHSFPSVLFCDYSGYYYYC